MTFPARIQGVFFNPSATMPDVARNPKPIAAILILILVLTAVFSYIAAPYAAKDGLQMMKDNVKMRERLGAERYDKMIADMENPKPGAGLLRAVVFTPTFTAVILGIQALFLLILGRLVSSEGAYIPALSVLLYAGLINTLLGNLVRTFLILSRKSVMQMTTSLAMLLPSADIASTPYILLSQFDLFQLWMTGVLGYGLAAVFKIPVKKGLILAFVFWALKAAVNIGFAFLGKSFMG